METINYTEQLETIISILSSIDINAILYLLSFIVFIILFSKMINK